MLPTVDPSLGALVNAELSAHGVDGQDQHDGQAHRPGARRARLAASRSTLSIAGTDLTAFADLVLVVVGVRPDTALAAEAGAELGIGGAIGVDRGMRTNLEVSSPPVTASSRTTA